MRPCGAAALALAVALLLLLPALENRRKRGRSGLPGALDDVRCYGAGQTHVSPALLSRLSVVSAQDFEPRAAPCLVRGLPPAPPLSDWRSLWGVEAVRVMFSPSGVFGAYGDCVTQLDESEHGVRFAAAHCRLDPRCSPRHVEYGADSSKCEALFREHAHRVYLRGTCSPATTSAYSRRHPGLRTLARLSPYLSAAGAVTNLHWDGAPGILAQTGGEKQVDLFEPDEMPRPAAASSPCARRSYLDGRQSPPGACLRMRLLPGWGLFIPARWGHHVTSLSPETLGAVWRLR